MDIVRPLGLAGIRCAVVAGPGWPTRYSRFSAEVIDWPDPWKHPQELLERLVRFGLAQPQRPVLFYESDWDLLLVSRHREMLAEAFQFVVGEPELVEDLADKGRFWRLAERLGLPVPRSADLSAGGDAADALHLPVIVKPLTRNWESWRPISGGAKALLIETRREILRVATQLNAAGVAAIAQEFVAGPETAVESYHVYVDESGAVAAEFTGKKIRTSPAAFGESTALEITDDDHLASVGREIVLQLSLRGVAKLDFKRAFDDTLHLMEINPRFTLWHHPGAKAGVNIPAIVYADLVGLQRPPASPTRANVQWCLPRADLLAARAAGISTARWLTWFAGCDAKSCVSWDDPLPAIRLAASQISQRLRPGAAEPLSPASPRA